MTLIQKKHVIVFLKAPIPGRVKTRLARDVGTVNAVQLYKAMMTDLLRNIMSPHYEVRYYVNTPEYPELVDIPEIDHTRMYQQNGLDLGEKMFAALFASFHDNAESALLIGSDIPYLDEEILTEYFHYLENTDMAIGPACDGGYYCIGFKNSTLHPSLFSGITWSTSSVYEHTIQKALTLGLEIHTGPGLRDIDTGDDLAAVLHDKTLTPKVPVLVKAASELSGAGWVRAVE